MTDFLQLIYPHLPVAAVMTLFLGAFFTALFGEKIRVLRNFFVAAAELFALLAVLLLIKPVFLDGQIIAYWMGGWEPVAGYAIGIGFTVDALSLFFALIVVLMSTASVFYAFRYLKGDDAHDKYFTLFLMLTAGVLGLFLTGDLFNMYVMVEIMTFSAVALTAFRNWYHGSLEAAFKYLVISSMGSTCILLGTALLYEQFHTLNMAQLAALVPGKVTPASVLSLALLLAGYAVKAFATPFHTIAADAHATAPSSVSVMISGVLTKTGVYGIIRVGYLLFQCMDRPAMRGLILLFGVSSMVVCVSMALLQHDFKRLLAFHSISQVGYVLTAVAAATPLAMAGGLYHALNHSLFKGLLFLCAGAVLYRTGTTHLDDLGGLAKRMPKTTVLFLIAAASISGIPPFNGFASKWMIYQSLFEAAAVHHNFVYIAALIAALLVSVMTLASFVKVAQSVFFGPLPLQYYQVEEAPLLMRIPMGVLAALCVLTGIFPDFMNRIFLAPATAAAFSPASYIDAMMGQGYAARVGGVQNAAAAYEMTGMWSPVAFLVLFGILVVVIALLPTLLGRKKDESVSDTRHDVFFGGEQSTYSHVGGGDLFWGMRRNLDGYLTRLAGLHTGLVIDYALAGALAIAFTVLYVFLFYGR